MITPQSLIDKVSNHVYVTSRMEVFMDYTPKKGLVKKIGGLYCHSDKIIAFNPWMLRQNSEFENIRLVLHEAAHATRIENIRDVDLLNPCEKVRTEAYNLEEYVAESASRIVMNKLGLCDVVDPFYNQSVLERSNGYIERYYKALNVDSRMESHRRIEDAVNVLMVWLT